MKLEKRMIGAVHVLSVAGDADLRGVPELQGAARELLDANDGPMVIDFETATFVNTPVWAVVVECYQRTQKSGQGFGVCGLSGRVRDSFDIVRLGEFVRTFSNVNEAAAFLEARD